MPTITGTSGADTYTGTVGADTISGLAGSDTLAGGAGADFIDGGADRDWIYAGEISPSFSPPYSNIAYIAPPLDTGSEVDTLLGGDGNDFLFVGYGDNVDGGAGEDFLYISLWGASSGVTLDFESPLPLVIGGGLIANIEYLVWVEGSNFNDSIILGGTSSSFANSGPIFGWGGDDTLVGGFYTEYFYGGSGNDVLDGRNSPYLERVYGDEGDDTIYTRNGSQAVGYGGDGNDTIYSAGMSSYGGDGNDTIYLQYGGTGSGHGDGGDDFITTSSQSSIMVGGSGSDTLTGGAGSDTLHSAELIDAGLERDILSGGAGDDTLWVGYGDDADGGEGTDRLMLSLQSAPAGITLDVTNIVASQTIALGGGTITGFESVSRLYGTAYADNFTLATQAFAIEVDAGAGDDTVTAGNSDDTLFGGAGNDSLTGGAGNNRLYGGTGDDTLTGGAGNDKYYVDSASDVVVEDVASGIDSVESSASYQLAANIEYLTLLSGAAVNGYGNEINNYITGNSNNNILRGFAGDDTLSGGGGFDTADYAYATSSISVNLSLLNSQAIGGGEGSDTFISIENVTGSAFGDTLTGNAAPNVLDGGVGADTLIGAGGNDTYIVDNTGDTVTELQDGGADGVHTSLNSYTLGDYLEYLTFTGSGNFVGTGNALQNLIRGGSGNDTLDGGAGFGDELIGGLGDDTYYIRHINTHATESLGQGTDVVYATFSGYTLDSEVENLVLEGSGFLGTGNILNNTIVGTAGADTINGAGGLDTLIGGEGNDSLDGGADADTLSGGSGNDTLDGGAGIDTLTGGAGNDTYYVDNSGDVVSEISSSDGFDIVYTSADYQLGANLENLTLQGSAISGLGNALDNAITGTSGDNILTGFAGDDTLNGGSGFDIASYAGASEGVSVSLATAGAQYISATEGSDSLLSIEGVTGSAFDDVLDGDGFANRITGGSGNDTLDGGVGIDTLIGGAGSDIYVLDNFLDIVTEALNEGTDEIRTMLLEYTLGANLENLTYTGAGNFFGSGNLLTNIIRGGSGNDTLWAGGSTSDTLYGGLGNDTMQDFGGAPTFVGGAGDDRYIVQYAATIIEDANEGVDLVEARIGSFTLNANVENLIYSGSGNFTGIGNALDNDIAGSFGADTLSGGDGNDTLNGAAGADSLSGGSGDDVYFVDSALDQVIEGASAGTDTIRTSVSVYSMASLGNVENLTFIGAGGFRGTGNASANILTGGAGSDTLTGGGGNDSLAGGTGFDTAAFSGAIANYTITDLGNGSYSVADLRGGAPDGTDTLTGIDSLQFTDGTITLAGSEKMPQALVGPLSWLTAGSVTNSNWASFSEVDAYRVVLQAGYTYTFSLTDTSGGRDTFLSLLDTNLNLVTYNDDVSLFNLNSSFTYTATSSGEYYLVAEELYGDTGSYSLTYRNLTGSDSILSNASTNRSIVVGGSSQTEWVEIAGDHDWYRVSLTAGQSYAFSLTGSGGAALTDPFLALRDSSGALVSFDDDGGAGTNSLLQFTATSSGTYYLDVSAYAQETGQYTLSAATGPAQDPLDTLDLGFTINHTNIAVYFATIGQNFSSSFTGAQAATSTWTTAQINAAFAAFNTFSAVTGLTFTQVGTSSGADFIMSLTNLTGALGQAFTTGGGQALIEFDADGQGWATGLQPGGYGFITLVHEIGHALGLDHPHYDGGDNQVMQGVLDSFDSYGTFQLNQGVYTTLGYNDGWPTGPLGLSASNNYGWQSGPMALDIAALQQAYGTNATTNSTNTTYALAASNTTGTSYQAIWDTGGADSISYTGFGNAVIDLRAATLQNAVGGGGYVSYVSGVIGGYTIANGVVIENATGGEGADYLIGNAAANVLTGGGGSDRLNAGTGLNTISGGSGVDTVDYSWTTLGARIDFGDGSNQGQSIGGGAEAFTDQLSGIERALGGSGADTFVIRSVTPGTVLGFYASAGSDTADFSLFASAIWIDLSYQVNDVWTRDNSALTSGTWRAIADLDGVERIIGTVYSDYVAGDAQDNTYVYNGGSDTIDLRGGVDTVDFSTFTAAVWVDLTYGDNDAWTRDVADLSIGTWRPIATLTNVENLIGSVYSDALYGNATTRLLSGGGGNDALYVRGVQSGVVASFDGGTGIDTLDFSSFSAAVWVHLDYSGAEAWTRDNSGVLSGNWRAIGDVTGIENLTGSAFSDDLTGNSSNNTFQYTGGFDLIDGQGGIDVVDFSRFNAAVWVDLAYAGVEAWTRDASTLTAGAWRTIADVANIEGAAGTQWNDQLAGSSGANVLLGGAGADEIEGRGGGDVLDGGDDVDTLKYTLSASAVTINLATNSASGGDAAGDTISNFENVIGSAGNDSLTGNNFDNILDGGLGADTLSGGAGYDIYIVDNANDVVVEALNEGRDLVRVTAVSYTMAANVENYERIGAAGYAVTGNGLDNTFYMSAITNGQIATVNGGAHGALGDTVDFSGFGAAVWVDLTYSGTPTEAWTRDTAGLTAGTYRGIADLSGIENIIGTLGDDHLVGDASDNVISYYGYLGAINGATSFGGRDYIDGGVGNDTADFSRINTGGIWIDLTYAGPEAWQQDFFGNWRVLADLDRIESLRGSDFNDILRGDSGNNIINGLDGQDLMTGGAGADAFVVGNGFYLGQDDTITDFTVGVDAIWLSLATFTAFGGAGAVSANHFVTGTTAADGDDWLIYNSATGALFYDEDGNGNARDTIQIATVTAGLSLSNNDFLIV